MHRIVSTVAAPLSPNHNHTHDSFNGEYIRHLPYLWYCIPVSSPGFHGNAISADPTDPSFHPNQYSIPYLFIPGVVDVIHREICCEHRVAPRKFVAAAGWLGAIQVPVYWEAPRRLFLPGPRHPLYYIPEPCNS